MNEVAKTTATIKDCKDYFEENSSRVFANEWKELDESDKVEIKELVWAEIG